MLDSNWTIPEVAKFFKVEVLDIITIPNISKEFKKLQQNSQNKANYNCVYIPCEVCGSEKDIIHHHFDYNRPLDTICLCRICHPKYHGKYENAVKIIVNLRIKEKYGVIINN